MLIEFTVGNYKSFKEKTTFSMVAANIKAQNKQLDENNVFKVDDDLSLLKSAAIYGANASGKSNLIAAMKVLYISVVTAGHWAQSVTADPFRLSVETDEKPSFFEIVLRIDGVDYRYGFEKIKSGDIVSEWLFHIPSTREAKLFSRVDSEFEMTPAFRREGRGLEEKTRKDTLFLRVVALFNGTISGRVLKALDQMFIANGIDDSYLTKHTVTLLRDKRWKKSVVDLMKKLDVGIEDLSFEPIREDAPDNHEDGVRVSFVASPRARTFHKMIDKAGKPTTIAFDLETSESEGTRKLYSLAGALIKTLLSGSALIIDEFDARLHPLIARRIVQLFNSKKENPHNAQLIFATHDTNLLDRELFRRDQVWFAEKDKFGATHLYSLVEYKERNDASFETNYIEGKYGAIPYIGDLSRILGKANA